MVLPGDAQLQELARRLGQRIRQLRKDRGITLEKLAYECSTISSKGYLSNVERGNRLPSVKALAGLAERLGVELHDIFMFPADTEGEK